MRQSISRRDFLKLGGLSFSSLAFHWLDMNTSPQPPEESFFPKLKARVTTHFINIYIQPDFKSDRIGILERDTIVRIDEEITSPYGPKYNPRWYRLEKGFVHSGHLQRVEKAYLNSPIRYVSEEGRLGEITVPYTQSMRKNRPTGWYPLYRLYYQSVHWITSLEPGPDGNLWYGLTDELLHVRYYVPAAHMRPIEPEELAPISPQVPLKDKRIEVSLGDQLLTAYEQEKIVLQTKISSGLPYNYSDDDSETPTDTPEGWFHVQVKVPSKHMGDGHLTNDLEAYELPGVPWVCFFHSSGVAFHGTYWHDNFGRKMSHGCVNMRTEEAKWLYRWTHPLASPEDWQRKGYGTVIKIFSE